MSVCIVNGSNGVQKDFKKYNIITKQNKNQRDRYGRTDGRSAPGPTPEPLRSVLECGAVPEESREGNPGEVSTSSSTSCYCCCRCSTPHKLFYKRARRFRRAAPFFTPPLRFDALLVVVIFLFCFFLTHDAAAAPDLLSSSCGLWSHFWRRGALLVIRLLASPTAPSSLVRVSRRTSHLASAAPPTPPPTHLADIIIIIIISHDGGDKGLTTAGRLFCGVWLEFPADAY